MTQIGVKMDKVPKVHLKKRSDGRFYVELSSEGNRFRFTNGDSIGINIHPNQLYGELRISYAEELYLEFKRALRKGWKPIKLAPVKTESLSVIELFKESLNNKLNNTYSELYIRDLKYSIKQLIKVLRCLGWLDMTIESFDKSKAELVLNAISKSQRVQHNYKLHYSALFTNISNKYKAENPFKDIRYQKQPERLHKPIKIIEDVLNEARGVSQELHLCCLLAYGCLLRPHREIRLLTWRDISEDFSQISLAGNQNKGKRNRIVPVGEYIKPYLKAFKSPLSTNEDNVFTGKKEPYNPDYFKTLWTRYKKKSKLIEKDQTLYSFRHTGAIQVYEKTGSLTKLQQVMGHSSLQVSLTYLRGLEVKQLDADDMPILEV